MDFSLIIRTYRQHMHMTQEQVANLIRESNRYYAGISVISLHRWEAGKVKPSLRKQCSILNSLGLDKCVGRIRLPEAKEFSEYLTRKYDSYQCPSYIRNHFDCKVISEARGSLDVFPEYLLEMLKLVYKEDDPKNYLLGILDAAESSHYYKYYDELNTMRGHLIFSSVSVKMFCELSKYDALFPLSRIKKTEHILYVICRFAGTKKVFLKQFLKMIDFVCHNKNIAFIYMRSYEDSLTKCLLKTTEGVVLTKYKDWTGILINPQKLKMLYSVFEPSSCSDSQQRCDVRTCYKG